MALHLVVTATILALTYLFFGWGAALRSPIPWLIFLAIYGLIWLYQIWQLHKKLNESTKLCCIAEKGNSPRKSVEENHEVHTKLRGFTFLISQNKVFFLTATDNGQFIF